MPVPRACGDAPLDHAVSPPTTTCSPRMRGCTGRVLRAECLLALFPAHAGMHRARTIARCLASTVPRACGDAPALTPSIARTQGCSPRMRGCTGPEDQAGDLAGLFPAHAGMHRPASSSPAASTAVPRACGDAPRSLDRLHGVHPCSPRMRGCTDMVDADLRDAQLFPAHAGMHRMAARGEGPCVSVPRACGDAPAVRVTLEELQPCSPRMRGCTELAGSVRDTAALFPAHAGMHRRSFTTAPR